MNILSQGRRVRVERLNNISSMFIEPAILKNRKIGVEGIALNVVPGYGVEVWFVQQEDGIAAYTVDEIIPIVDHSRAWTADEMIRRES